MPTYIALLTFTEQGTKALTKTTARAEAFRKVAEKRGIKILKTYWVNGPFDIIHIFEVDKHEDAMAHSYSLSSLGNVRTQTYQAYTRDEVDPILKNVFNPYDLLEGQD
jgi:uncharacterized protein with GYD domain